VGPVYRGSASDQHLLRSCYEKSLQLAIDNRLATIAFPAISCGVYGYPIEEAAAIAIDATTRCLEETDQLKMVTFVLFSRHDFDIYSKMTKTPMKFVFPVDKTGLRE